MCRLNVKVNEVGVFRHLENCILSFIIVRLLRNDYLHKICRVRQRTGDINMAVVRMLRNKSISVEFNFVKLHARVDSDLMFSLNFNSARVRRSYCVRSA